MAIFLLLKSQKINGHFADLDQLKNISSSKLNSLEDQ